MSWNQENKLCPLVTTSKQCRKPLLCRLVHLFSALYRCYKMDQQQLHQVQRGGWARSSPFIKQSTATLKWINSNCTRHSGEDEPDLLLSSNKAQQRWNGRMEVWHLKQKYKCSQNIIYAPAVKNKKTDTKVYRLLGRYSDSAQKDRH